MKRLLAMLFAITMLAPAFISAQEIKKDDTATVSDWTWVAVKNMTPVQSGNGTFKYGDTCGIKRGATLLALGTNRDLVLAQYLVDTPQYGSSCPSGIVFFLKKIEFVGMTTQFYKVLKVENAEKDLVARLTGGKKKG